MITPSTLIDSHVHLWSPTRLQYSWLTGHGEGLDRDFTADDLRAETSSCSDLSIVFVQADDSYVDLHALLLEARAWPGPAAAIGWLPLDRPGELQAALEAIAAPELRGVRTLSHTYGDDLWLSQPSVVESAAILAERGLVLEVAVGSAGSRDAIAALATACPDVELVIDHLGAPPRTSDLGPWRDFVSQLATRPRTTIKVSGLATREGIHDIDFRDWVEPLQFVLEMFGANRMMFGSDWPVSRQAGSYDQIFDATITALGPLDSTALDRILRLTAQRVYLLGKNA